MNYYSPLILIISSLLLLASLRFIYFIKPTSTYPNSFLGGKGNLTNLIIIISIFGLYSVDKNYALYAIIIVIFICIISPKPIFNVYEGLENKSSSSTSTSSKDSHKDSGIIKPTPEDEFRKQVCISGYSKSSDSDTLSMNYMINPAFVKDGKFTKQYNDLFSKVDSSSISKENGCTFDDIGNVCNVTCKWKMLKEKEKDEPEPIVTSSTTTSSAKTSSNSAQNAAPTSSS